MNYIETEVRGIMPFKDDLDICFVEDTMFISSRGLLYPGEICAYFAPGSLVNGSAFHPNIQKYLVLNTLVKTRRIHGIESFGFGIPIEGDMSKFEVDIKKPEVPGMLRYPRIPELGTRMQTWNRKVTKVVVTEKIKGKHCRICKIGGGVFYGDRNHRVKKPGSCDNILEYYKRTTRENVIFFGVVDNGVCRVHDLMINGRFVDYEVFEYITKKFGIPVVPVLSIGELGTGYNKDVVIKSYEEEISLELGRHITKRCGL